MSDQEKDRIPPRRAFTFELDSTKTQNVLNIYKDVDDTLFKRVEKKKSSKKKFL